jgi:hypothetical protein
MWNDCDGSSHIGHLDDYGYFYHHCENGYAVIYADGSGEYWLFNCKLSKKEYERRLKLKVFW